MILLLRSSFTNFESIISMFIIHFRISHMGIGSKDASVFTQTVLEGTRVCAALLGTSQNFYVRSDSHCMQHVGNFRCILYLKFVS